jgi:membrane protease YdiL (CAAX protease family)
MVSEPRRIEPTPIRPTLLVHQEGVLALLALVGLSFSETGLRQGLSPSGPAAVSMAAGIAVGAAVVAVLWLARPLPPLRRLERWQRAVVGEWTVTDAVVVAALSGLAEEALLRAFLQPIIGLLPAAALFAVLHLVPDRRLWIWPVFALACGVALGFVFERFGYPAAAAAHVVINLVALLRLRRASGD